MPLNDALRSHFDDLVKKHNVVLFMKGNKHFPQCGFSAQVVGILKELGTPFETVNVLQNPEIRDGIKEYSSWPTIPQLYVGGEFIGGCDIVKEMFASGDLQKKLGVEVKPVTPPKVTLSDGAVKAIKDADEGNGDKLRLEVSPQFQYELYFGPKQPSDIEVVANGVTMLFDRESAKRADGMTIAWVETPDGGAFKMENPNEPPRVKQLSVKELKAWRDGGREHVLVDARSEEEWALSKIEGSVQLDDEGEKKLASMPKDTPLAFLCHHGVRSRSVAEQFLRAGYTRVFNVEGGIAAWSAQIDPSVRKY
jgi:monothiol glutaredoxin